MWTACLGVSASANSERGCQESEPALPGPGAVIQIAEVKAWPGWHKLGAYRRHGRLTLALLTGAVSLALLLPQINRWADFPDEDQYAWSGAYFLQRIGHSAFDPGSGTFADPGWSSTTYWALTQPMGARYLYGLVLGVTGKAVPAQPYDYPQRVLEPSEQYVGQEAARLDWDSRQAMRVTAAVSSALALGLIVLRLGWLGLYAVLAVLVAPQAGTNLVMGWAEGPLLLALALCVATYGRRGFGPMLAVAAAVKLTAVALWPLLLIPGCSGRGRWARLIGGLTCLGLWTLLEPPSWFARPWFGPLYLWLMLRDRLAEHAMQTALNSGSFFLSSRYALEGLFLCGIGAAAGLRICWGRWRACAPATVS